MTEMGPFGIGLTYFFRKMGEGYRPIGTQGLPLEGESAIAFLRKRQLETNTPVPFIEWDPKEERFFCCYKCSRNLFKIRILYLEDGWNPLPASENEKKLTHIFTCDSCGSQVKETSRNEIVKGSMELANIIPHLSGEDEDSAGELREKLRDVRRELLQYKSHFGKLPKDTQAKYEI